MHTTTPEEFIMPFGKYAGETLGDIYNLDGGEDYLDWLLGWLEETAQTEKDVYKNVCKVLGR